MKRIAFKTFGCKLNYSESSDISGDFAGHGFQTVDFEDQADIYVINTCTVTANAEKKCRAAIRQAVRRNPAARVAVIGCFSELKSREIASIKGVDLILGTKEKFRLMHYLNGNAADQGKRIYTGGVREEKAFIPAWSRDDRTRSFLKIQDGCDYYCSYCTIPMARGSSRSDLITHVVQLANEIHASGVKEIILTGVNIGDFGKHNHESLLQLIRRLSEDTGIERYRISSIEPDLLSDEIIEFVASSEKFLPHFHIPLQSGSDKILKAMRRKYQTALFSELVKNTRDRMPLCMIAADVIAGFPGETEEDFIESYEFIKSLDISYMHVFTYSERINTMAAGIPGKVPPGLRHQRSEILHRLSEEKKKNFYEKNKGRKAKVLFESENKQGSMFGFTENYLRVKTAFDPELINEIKELELTETDKDGVYQICF